MQRCNWFEFDTGALQCWTEEGHCGVMVKPSSVIEVEVVVDVLMFGAVKAYVVPM